MKASYIVGTLLFILGAALFFGLFPVMKEMSKGLAENRGDYDVSNYPDHQPGDTVFVSGEVGRSVYTGDDVLWQWTLISIGVSDQTVCQLDFSGNNKFFFLVSGNCTGDVPLGFDIWTELTLKTSKVALFGSSGEYWTAESADSIHYAIIPKIGFFCIAIAGVVVVVLGLRSRK